MENSRRCEICNIDIHRASYAKHLRSKKHFDNEKVVPARLFKEEQTHINNKIKKVYNHESSK